VSTKILHFIDSGGLYGAESVILNLSREMQTDDTYTPVVGCIVSHPDEISDLYDKTIEFGVDALKLVIRNSFLFVDIPRAARRLKKNGISLIHSHGYKPSVFGFLIRLATGIPIIATCHLWFLQEKIPVKMRVMIMLELLSYRLFSTIVAVSRAIKVILVEHGVAENKIEMIKNGIVLSDYSSLSDKIVDQLRKDLQLKHGEFCFLNVARLTHQKAQCHIVSVARMLKEAGEKVKFFIVGEGPLRDDLQQQIIDNGVQDCVRLLGFRQDVNDLLQVADVFILPSIDEGMPMALLEAVASKTPILATPVGDITKLIQDGRSGVIVKVDDIDDLFDGALRLISSAELRQSCAEFAWEKMHKEYSSLAMYRSYIEIYDGILGCG